MAASKGPEFTDLFTSGGGDGLHSVGEHLSSINNGSSPYDHLISSSLEIYDPYRNVAAYGQHSVYRVPQRVDEDYHQTYHNEVDIDPGENGTFLRPFHIRT